VLTKLRSILDEATPELMPRDPAPPPLPALVETLQGAAGAVCLEFGLDAVASAPAPVCSAVANFVNEGVRNALKHADPSHASVDASFESGVLRVSVANDGVRRASSDRGIGLRLLGLDAERLGGAVSVEQEEQTWQLTLTLPVTRPT
jgi:signal transduction histidine kinase